MAKKTPDGGQVPLSNDAIVVRFGLMGLKDVQRSAERCRRVRGYFGLSMFGDNGLSIEDTARQAQQPHPFLRSSSAGRLRSADFKILRTGRWPHLTIKFSQSSSGETLSKLIELFDAPTPNPHAID